MNVFLGMETPASGPMDFPGLLLSLQHLWPIFVIPVVCFYAVLSVWVVKKVRSALAGGSGPKPDDRSPGPDNLSSQPTCMTAEASNEKGEPPAPLDADFYCCFPLAS